ncbi:glycerate kinase [Zhaonella formicivorans]|uniref:glycerate kinase n=1 Tax=Zhaonella formicivorans TaxID=2528593 RepID=UPI0010E0C979|nr:glycerate kinase [Zhaonella formicivorans]
MRVVVAPDSYKGSMSAVEVADIIEKGLKTVFPDAEISKVPIADGGEGTVDAFLAALGGERRELEVTGPLGDKVKAFFGILPGGETAVVEMAAASGLPLVPPEKRNPLVTTTYGTGELIKAALEAGCSTIIVGIGGSATNDGGMGMAQALGIGFYDSRGEELGFGGENLGKLAKIEMAGLNPKVKTAKILVACDVDNPLCGPHGASAVFGPQKGATPEMVEVLDRGLACFARVIKEQAGADIFNMPGAGAAGGLGAGLVGLLGAELRPGIEIVIENTGLAEKISGADLVITGEGRTDFQTARGKAPVGIARLAKKYQVPVIAISGSLGDGYQEVYEAGLDAVFSIVPGPITLDMAMQKGKDYLLGQVVNIARLVSLFRR